MRPALWQPLVAPSAAEEAIIKRIRRAKLFVFLREQRHELFSDAFQAELATLYQDSPLGQQPILQPNWRWRLFCKPVRGFR